MQLNRDFRSDRMGWRMFVASWNSLSPSPSYLPRLQMASDASGSWGCGAWHGHSWFQLQWDSRPAHLPIMVKELLPIVLACSVWGPTWDSCQVVCLCDHQAIVACLRSRTSRVAHVMHMLRTLAFIEARDAFTLTPQYIDTKSNHWLGLAASAPAAQRYFRDGLAPSTRHSYYLAMKKSTTFCEHLQVLCPFPVTEGLLCSFAAFMADAGLVLQTGQSYLVAIRNIQLSLGLPDPREQSSLPALRRVLAGISQSRLGRGQPSRVRLPITATLLHNIKRELDRSAIPERLVLWAVCCAAFFGFFPPRRTSAHQAVRLPPRTPPLLGGHGH